MKHVLYALFLALTLICAGCGKYEVYERNLVYMTQDTLIAERAALEKRLEAVQTELSQAEASDDSDRVVTVRKEYKTLAQQKRILDREFKRRARGW
ncbi:hypothetical protein JCM15519_18120 [Fundidesulfovibrio butyratiphilus]